MTVPDIETADKIYALFRRIMQDLTDPRRRRREARFGTLFELHQVTSDLYLAYSSMLEAFEKALPWHSEEHGYHDRSEPIGKKDVAKAVTAAKRQLDEHRRALRADRSVWKENVAGWLATSIDKEEQRFLIACYWFFEYRDDYTAAIGKISNDDNIDDLIAEILEKGGSAPLSTAGSQFHLRTGGENDPEVLRAEALRMLRHLSAAYRQVVRRFRELEVAWRI